MIIYPCARYSRREEIVEYMRILSDDGHECHARWLLGPHQWNNTAHNVVEEYENRGVTIGAAQQFAIDDIQDLNAAHIVMCFTEKPQVTNATRGGRHVEFGYAYAIHKPIIVIMDEIPENAFYLLPGIVRFNHFEQARQFIYMTMQELQHTIGNHV